MNIKRLIAALLALLMIASAALAQGEYILDVQVSARALDGSSPEGTPQPTPTPSPTPAPTATPEPTATPVPTPTPYAGTYEIEVDLHNQIVTVYRGQGRTAGDIARQMICSSGLNNATPLGEFIMPEVQKVDEREAWYYIGKFRLHVQYASRIVRDILFHSLPSTRNGASPTEETRLALGTRASHGCIRLRPADSRWIAENCPPGTKVNIFDGGFADEELRSLLLVTSYDSALMDYQAFQSGAVLLSVSSELPQVKDLQEQLNLLGYACAENNGVFGAATHAAVTLWQEHNGFAANGELNEAQYARLMADQPGETPVDMGRQASVKVSSGLSLREKPSSKSARLDVLANGTTVYVLEEEGGWYKVRANGRTGYVGRKYIEFAD